MVSVTWVRRVSIVSDTPAMRVSRAAITSALFWFSDVVKLERRVAIASLTVCARVSNVFWNWLRCDDTTSSIDLMRVSRAASSVVTRSSNVRLEGAEVLVERVDAIAHLRLQRAEVLLERRAHLGGVGRDAGVERIDVVLQAVGDVLRALAEPVDDLAAERLHGAVEFGDVARDQRAERA